MSAAVSRFAGMRWAVWAYPMKLLAAVLALIVGAPTVYGFVQWEHGNFAVVSAQQVYRSRQLTGPELTTAIAQHGIKSILNLRGENQGSRWYQEEVSVTRARGVQMANYSLSANRTLTPMEVAELLTLMRTLPKPMLIHCHSGADRTGLAAALYLSEVEGASPQVASKQLSVMYGHMPAVLGAKSRAMDDTFWRVVNHE